MQPTPTMKCIEVIITFKEEEEDLLMHEFKLTIRTICINYNIRGDFRLRKKIKFANANKMFKIIMQHEEQKFINDALEDIATYLEQTFEDRVEFNWQLVKKIKHICTKFSFIKQPLKSPRSPRFGNSSNNLEDAVFAQFS